jgi:hypothetical protein
MRTFKDIQNDDATTVIHPADPWSLAVFQAMKSALEAEAELDKALSDPALNYTGQYEAIDFHGGKEIAFNRAVDHLGSTITNMVVAKTKEIS